MSQPALVSVTDLVQAAAASFRLQLATVQGTRILQYVAATGADTGAGLPGYLLCLQHGGRWRAVAHRNSGWLRRRSSGNGSSVMTGFASTVRQRASVISRMLCTLCSIARAQLISTPCTHICLHPHILRPFMISSPFLIPSSLQASAVRCTPSIAPNSNLFLSFSCSPLPFSSFLCSLLFARCLIRDKFLSLSHIFHGMASVDLRGAYSAQETEHCQPQVPSPACRSAFHFTFHLSSRTHLANSL